MLAFFKIQISTKAEKNIIFKEIVSVPVKGMLLYMNMKIKFISWVQHVRQIVGTEDIWIVSCSSSHPTGGHCFIAEEMKNTWLCLCTKI